MMFIGFICAKCKILNEETNKRLSNFVLLVANPLAIFLSYQRPFEIELLENLLMAFLLSLSSYAVALVVAHIIYKKRGKNDYAIEKICCIYTNSGFIGIPLVQGIFGSEGVFYLTAYLTTFNLFVWTHGVFVMRGSLESGFIKKVVLNIPVLSVFIGLVFFIFGISLPQFLTEPMATMGATNTPLAMLVAGVAISSANFVKILKNYKIFIVSFMRLLIIPIIQIVIFSSFNIHPVVFGTILLAASCPAAMTVIFFAYRYDRDTLYGSEVFVATTLLSVITIPLVLLLI